MQYQSASALIGLAVFLFSVPSTPKATPNAAHEIRTALAHNYPNKIIQLDYVGEWRGLVHLSYELRRGSQADKFLLPDHVQGLKITCTVFEITNEIGQRKRLGSFVAFDPSVAEVQFSFLEGRKYVHQYRLEMDATVSVYKRGKYEHYAVPSMS